MNIGGYWKALMDIKVYLLAFFIAYTLRAGIRIVAEDKTAGKKKIVNFCFNASLEGKCTRCGNEQTYFGCAVVCQTFLKRSHLNELQCTT